MESSQTLSDTLILEQKMLEYLREVDLSQLSSPYLSKTFTLWRTELYNSYRGPMEPFIDLIDNTYLPKYLNQISNCYKLSILSSPEVETLPKHDEVTTDIVSILTEWTVQIELSVDIIQRASLYGLYKISDTQEQLFEDLQKEWKNSDKPSNIFFRYCLGYFSSITFKLKEYVSESIKSFIIGNLFQYHGIAMIKIFCAYFSSTMPYPIIAIMGAKFIYVFMNIVGDKVGGKIIEPIERANLHLKLVEIKSELKNLTGNLKETNLIACQLIRQACLDPMQDLRSLNAVINELINHEPDQHVADEPVEEAFIAKYSNVHEEDDWMIIDPPPMYSELLEDWIIFE